MRLKRQGFSGGGAGGNWPKNKERVHCPFVLDGKCRTFDLSPAVHSTHSFKQPRDISTSGFEAPNIDAAEAAFPLKVSGWFPTLGRCQGLALAIREPSESHSCKS